MQSVGALATVNKVINPLTNVLISPAQIASPSNVSLKDHLHSNVLPEHAQSTPLSWSSQCKTPTLSTTTIINNNDVSLALPLTTHQTANSAATTT